jgi:hypothetical protein
MLAAVTGIALALFAFSARPDLYTESSPAREESNSEPLSARNDPKNSDIDSVISTGKETLVKLQPTSAVEQLKTSPSNPQSNPKSRLPLQQQKCATGESNAGTPANGGIVHVNTTANSVLVVKGRKIEPINLLQRAKLPALTKRFMYLLKELDPPLPASTRRVWIDVGARFFLKGSTQWFMRSYPEANLFEAHMFELLDQESGYGPAKRFFKSFQYHKTAVWTHSNGVVIKGMKMATVLESRKCIASDNRVEWRTNSTDLAQFLLDNYTEEDFVVMKFDIEGGEWTVIPHLIKQNAIRLVDEMFFECHPQLTLDQGTYLPQECVDFTNYLRELGVHCHRWT